jgi:hypothetical protein
MSRFYGECRFAPCSETDRLAVRHGIETRYDGRLYRESFAPDCWAAKAGPATIRLGHDGEDVGLVVVVASHGQWHHASFVIEDGPLLALAREQIVVGAKVSLDCRTWKPDEDHDLRLVRHELAWLNHIAILQPGDVPGHAGAIVTRVWEAKPKLALDLGGYVLREGDEVIDHERGILHRHESGVLVLQ